MTHISFRTKPEPHNTQFIEAMAVYHFAGTLAGGKRVLDAGCGFGYGTDYLSTLAGEATGIDKDREAIDWAKNNYRRKNITFILADAANTGFSDGRFDVVCLFELIHQVKEYQKLLKEMHRVLKKGGTLFVSSRRKDKELPGNDPSHLRLFTAQEMKALLAEAGFSGVTMYGLERPAAVYRLESELAGVRRSALAGIKRFIPRRSVSALVYLFARMRGVKAPQDLKYEDFKISAGTVNTAPGILAVCKKA